MYVCMYIYIYIYTHVGLYTYMYISALSGYDYELPSAVK